MKRYLFIAVMLAGCGPISTVQQPPKPDVPSPTDVFDISVGAGIVADVAEMDPSPLKDSQIIKGMLGKSADFKVPESLVTKVYDAVPDLHKTEPFDLSADQIARIRAIKAVSSSWNGTGPLWFRSEKHIRHGSCDGTCAVANAFTANIEKETEKK